MNITGFIIGSGCVLLIGYILSILLYLAEDYITDEKGSTFRPWGWYIESRWTKKSAYHLHQGRDGTLVFSIITLSFVCSSISLNFPWVALFLYLGTLCTPFILMYLKHRYQYTKKEEEC